MLDVINITAPIFFLISLGYLGVKFAILPGASLPGLSRFVLYYALPALVFSNLLKLEFSNLINPTYLLVYGLGGLITMGLMIIASRFMFKDRWQSAGVRGIGAALPNSVLIGFPILLQFFDNPPVAAFTMALLVENLLLLPIALIFIEISQGESGKQTGAASQSVLKRCLTHPIILSVFAAMIAMTVDLHLPDFIARSLDMLTAGAASVALVVIGGSLVGVSIVGNIRKIMAVALAKLLVFPALVFVLLLFMPAISHELKVAVLIFSAMPMFSIYPIIGNNYDEGQFCASALFVTTLLSFFTVNLLLSLLI